MGTRLARMVKRRLLNESGQVVVLFALLLPVFLGVGALVVDIGVWYVTQKQAQNAADAAALAGAREIPNKPVVETFAIEYVGRHMPAAAYEIEYPYVPATGPNAGVPDPTMVEVTVTHPAGSFFGKVFGISGVTVTRRAVAEKLDGEGNMAIFAHSNPGCGSGTGLEFNGENISINGFIHSNGQFRVDAGPFWAADGTISRNNCVSSIDEDADSQFGPDPTACEGSPCREPRDVFETLNWPAWYTPAEFGWFTSCTYRGQKIEITSNQVKITAPDQTIGYTGVLPSGVYCATESFKIAADNVGGTFTALAPEVVVDGNNQNFTPYSQDVLFFTVPNNDFVPENDGSLAAGGNPTCNPNPAKETVLNGNGHTWAGTIFNPCGRVYVNVSGSTVGSPALVGTIIAKHVKIDGDDFFMIGDSPEGGQFVLSLLE